MRIAFFLNVMNRVKLRRICMQSSENNGAYISKTIHQEMLVFGNYITETRPLKNVAREKWGTH